MPRIALFFTLLTASALGCSSADFGIAASSDDAATTDDASATDDAATTDDASASDGAPTDDASTDETGDACVKNACGGCTTLANPPGTPCGGTCSSAEYACDGTEATKCVDPVTTPAPGTACGTCNTLQRVCASDGLSTVCPGDDANACGGCAEIPSTQLPGEPCGKCGSGTYLCAATKDSTRCDDPVPATHPAPGAKCGLCGTSAYRCNAAKDATYCEKEDDRVAGTDTYQASDEDRLFTVAPGEVPSIAVAFETRRAGSITDLSLAFQRFDASTDDLMGSLRIRLIKGTPTTSPAAADVLATVSVPGETVPDLPGPINVKLPTATPHLPAKTALWIEITDASARFNFELHGSEKSGPSDLQIWYPDTTSATGWSSASKVWPHLKVVGLGCF